MSIIASEGSNLEFHTLPIGNYQSCCFDIWDIGYQKGEYKGEKVAARKVVIGWEVNEVIESNDDFNGQRFRIYGWYTLSLDKKATLRKDLTSWRGKEFTEAELKSFDVESVIGANCFLNVIHKENGKPKVSSIGSLPKNMPEIVPENKRGTPDWIKKQLAKAITEDEYKVIRLEMRERQSIIKSEEHPSSGGNEYDDIPF